MALGKQLNLRLSEDEAQDIADAAADAGYTVSEWARAVLVHAAGRVQLSQAMERGARANSRLALGDDGAKVLRKGVAKIARKGRA